MKIVFSKMTGGLLLFTLLVSLKVNASLPQAKNDSVFHLVQPDYKLSVTGGIDPKNDLFCIYQMYFSYGV